MYLICYQNFAKQNTTQLKGALKKTQSEQNLKALP